MEWRADATYAAVAAKIIAEHIQQFYINKAPSFIYNLLSNDNAFLSYYPHQFTQRTLFARFQMNNTKIPYTEFIKKPIYSAIGLFGMLGKKLIQIKGNWIKSKTLGALATINNASERFEFILLLYNSHDTSNFSSYNYLDITVDGINTSATKDIRMIQYHINNEKTNPFLLWKKFGCPPYPTLDQFKVLRSVEEPFRSHKPQQLFYPPWKFYLKIPLPGITLLYICDKHDFPTYISKVRILNISQETIIITWKDLSNRCLLTYEVQFSSSGILVTYKRINTEDSIFLSFTYSQRLQKSNQFFHHCPFKGYYRIRAIDFWKQKGPFSTPLFYSC